MKTYTITITGTVGISYWIPIDAAQDPEEAIARVLSGSPEYIAETMKRCAAYELESIQRDLVFSDGNESNQLVWHYCLSWDQRSMLEFESPDAVGDDGIELTADALATRHYTFKAKSLDDALNQFSALTAEQLNEPRWTIGAMDLEPEVLVWGKPYEVDEDVLFDIAGYLEITL